VPLGDVLALSWCGDVSRGGIFIIISMGCLNIYTEIKAHVECHERLDLLHIRVMRSLPNTAGYNAAGNARSRRLKRHRKLPTVSFALGRRCVPPRVFSAFGSRCVPPRVLSTLGSRCVPPRVLSVSGSRRVRGVAQRDGGVG